MTTKQILFSTIIFGAATNIALGMDNKNTEEAIFQNNVKQLSKPVAHFVMDFKTWPKEERDKIKTYRAHDGKALCFINGNPYPAEYRHVLMSYFKKSFVSPMHTYAELCKEIKSPNKDPEIFILKMYLTKPFESATYAELFKDYDASPNGDNRRLGTYHTEDGSVVYFIDGEPIASNKYNGSIDGYLERELNKEQAVPFFDAIDYLKKQQ